MRALAPRIVLALALPFAAGLALLSACDPKVVRRSCTESSECFRAICEERECVRIACERSVDCPSGACDGFYCVARECDDETGCEAPFACVQGLCDMPEDSQYRPPPRAQTADESAGT